MISRNVEDLIAGAEGEGNSVKMTGYIARSTIGLLCIMAILVFVFPKAATQPAYGQAGGDTDCPGGPGHTHAAGEPCPGNDTGCTNDPDPDQVEEVDRWEPGPAISKPADLKIAGPTVVCVGSTASYAFDRSGQSGPLDHGVTDDDTHITGTITTKYKLNENCESVIDDVIDDTNEADEADSVSHDWSVTGGGTIEKDGQGYGDFTAPATGGTVTVKATFSDAAPAVDDGSRNDAPDGEETLSVKVLEVVDLECEYSEPFDLATAPSDVEVAVVEWSGLVGSKAAVTVNTTLGDLTNDEWNDVTGCYSLSAHHSDASGTVGTPVEDAVVDETTVEIPRNEPGFYLVVATAGSSEKRLLVAVLKLTLEGKLAGSSEYGTDMVEIAAGAIDNGNAHKAAVRFTYQPSLGSGHDAEIRLTGDGGGQAVGEWWWTMAATPTRFSFITQTGEFEHGHSEPFLLSGGSIHSGILMSSNLKETTTIEFKIPGLEVLKRTLDVSFAVGDFAVDSGIDAVPVDQWHNVSVSRSIAGEGIRSHEISVSITKVTVLEPNGSGGMHAVTHTAQVTSSTEYDALDEYIEMNGNGGLYQDVTTNNAGQATVQIKVVDPNVLSFELGAADFTLVEETTE